MYIFTSMCKAAIPMDYCRLRLHRIATEETAQQRVGWGEVGGGVGLHWEEGTSDENNQECSLSLK